MFVAKSLLFQDLEGLTEVSFLPDVRRDVQTKKCPLCRESGNLIQ